MPFQKGNQEWKKRSTSGRPSRLTEEKYLRWMLSRVSRSDWQEITDKAIRDAKRGDSRARQWLADWCLGKPIERHENEQVGEIRVRWISDDEPGPDDPV